MLKLDIKEGGVYSRAFQVDGDIETEIRGLTAIDLHLSFNEPTIASLKIAMVQGSAVINRVKWFIVHPITGEMVAIKSVELMDDTTLSFRQDGSVSDTTYREMPGHVNEIGRVIPQKV